MNVECFFSKKCVRWLVKTNKKRWHIYNKVRLLFSIYSEINAWHHICPYTNYIYIYIYKIYIYKINLYITRPQTIRIKALWNKQSWFVFRTTISLKNIHPCVALEEVWRLIFQNITIMKSSSLSHTCPFSDIILWCINYYTTQV